MIDPPHDDDDDLGHGGERGLVLRNQWGSILHLLCEVYEAANEMMLL